VAHGKTNWITVIYGMKGYGKSFKLEMLTGLRPRTLWFDPFGLYRRTPDDDYVDDDGKTQRGFRSIFPGWERTSDIAHVVRTIAGELNPFPLSLVRKWRSKPIRDYRLMFIPPTLDEGSEEEYLSTIWHALVARFDRLADDLGEHRVPSSTIVIDEVDGLNRGHNPSKSVEKFIKRGRHLTLSQFYATRRPHECPRLVSSQADESYLFRVEEHRDLEYLSQRGIPEAVIDALPTLPKGAYYRVSPTETPPVHQWRPAHPV
jgi:hypothetical protein